jgi:DNA polymerase sigma
MLLIHLNPYYGISLNYDAFDLSINNVNGDIYISYATASVLSITIITLHMLI